MKILGIMSGSSLDGIDLALCEFIIDKKNNLSWKILKATTIAYSEEWVERLKVLPKAGARELTLADYELGYLFGEISKKFLVGEQIDYISSHGHTVFHEPQNRMTLQIGNGSAIASAAGVPTIYDFRSMDIGYGGQGAPIVAIMDRDLFSQYDALVNLGGISNISITNTSQTIAYDISPCNQLLNFLAGKKGLDYDKGGFIASKGKVNKKLLKNLMDFEFFSAPFPKSLDNNFIKNKFFPILENDNASVEDQMATVIDLIAETLVDEVKKNLNSVKPNAKIMFAGGGTKNDFLMYKIKEKAPDLSIIIPDIAIIDFKEALLMAYLGYLRASNKINTLCSVTGAKNDSIGGAICLK